MDTENLQLLLENREVGGNPFVGLRPFATEDGVRFFGRREQVSDLLRKLHQTRFLGAVGSSGCGKSSLVRAGLIPALQAGFLVADRDAWQQVEMNPGPHPLRSLADALRSAGGGASGSAGEGLAAELRRYGSTAVVETLWTVLSNNMNVLLLVDQFEEIFRYDLLKSRDTREEALIFVSILLALTQEEQLPFYVVMTMRSDFIGDCDAFPGLPEVLNRSLYLVPRLTRQQRREAIEGPILMQGGRISSRLLDLLLNEKNTSSDQLPVLQHALMRTWEKWREDLEDHSAIAEKRSAIDTCHYEKAGTLAKALDLDAKQALGSVDSDLARRIFQSLTETDPANRRVRHSARLSELRELTGATTEAIESVIKAFNEDGRCFLAKSPPRDPDPMVDISHESLIRRWEDLRKWVEDAAESAAAYRRLEEATADHQAGKAGLLPDPQLQIALDWWETTAPTTPWARRVRPAERFRRDHAAAPDTYLGARRIEALETRPERPSLEQVKTFLDESRAVRDREAKRRDDERERERQKEQDHALSLERAKQTEARARARQRWLRVFVPLCVLTGLIAVALVVVATYLLNQRRVDHLVDQARSLFPASPQRSLLLSSQALRVADAVPRWSWRPDTLEAENLMRTVLSQTGGRGLGWPGRQGIEIRSLAVSPDARWLASASADGRVWLWNLNRPRPRPEPPPGEPPPGPAANRLRNLREKVVVAVAADWLAIGREDGSVTLRSLGRMGAPPPWRPASVAPAPISALALSSSGRWLVAGDEQGRAWRWDLAKAARPFVELGHATGRAVLAARISRDDRLLVTWSAGSQQDDRHNQVAVWKLDPPELLQDLKQDFEASPADLSADGRCLIRVENGQNGAENSVIYRIDTQSNKTESIVLEKARGVTAVKISPDTGRLLTRSEDGSLRLWHLPSTKGSSLPLTHAQLLRGHDGSATAFEFSRTGDRDWLLTGGEDGTLRFWDLKAPDPSSPTVLYRGPEYETISSASLSPDGHHLALGYPDGSTTVWTLDDSRGASPVAIPPDSACPKCLIASVKMSADGRWLVRTSVPAMRMGSGSDASADDTELWAMSRHPQVVPLKGLIDIAGDGKSAIARTGDALKVWSLTGSVPSRARRAPIPADVKPPLARAVLSSNQRYLMASDANDAVWLWDLENPAGPPQPLYDSDQAGDPQHRAEVSVTTFSKDSLWLGVGWTSGDADAWSLPKGKKHLPVRLRGHSREITAIVFLTEPSADNPRVITASNDGTARLFPLQALDKKREPQTQRIFEGHRGPILAAWASNDEHQLATAGRDGTIRVWDVTNPTSEPAVAESHEGGVAGGIFSEDGLSLMSVSLDGTVHRWSIDHHRLLAQAEQVVGRNLSCVEWDKYTKRLFFWAPRYAFPDLGNTKDGRRRECEE